MKIIYKKMGFTISCMLLFVLAPINKLMALSNTYFFDNPKPLVTIPYAPISYHTILAKADDSLHLQLYGCSEQAYNYAIKGYEILQSTGLLAKQIISIIDFSKPSSQKRLFVIDMQQSKLLFSTYVAHGQGSGQAVATQFSNSPESLKSSLGFYKTCQTYIGRNGFSLKLAGLEKGINDKAAERSIVMHGAAYVSKAMLAAQGYMGRSWGCPAVSLGENKSIIDKIKNGSCLFIYSTNQSYLSHSNFLQ